MSGQFEFSVDRLVSGVMDSGHVEIEIMLLEAKKKPGSVSMHQSQYIIEEMSNTQYTVNE